MWMQIDIPHLHNTVSRQGASKLIALTCHLPNEFFQRTKYYRHGSIINAEMKKTSSNLMMLIASHFYVQEAYISNRKWYKRQT